MGLQSPQVAFSKHDRLGLPGRFLLPERLGGVKLDFAKFFQGSHSFGFLGGSFSLVGFSRRTTTGVRQQMTEVKNVGIGEIVSGKGDVRLTTVLGSCVGIAMMAPEKNFAVLAHVLRPGHSKQGDAPGRCAESAVPAMIEVLQEHGIRQNLIVATIAGGANVLNSFSENAIGQLNVQSVEKALKKSRIKLASSNVGGSKGTKYSVNCNSGTCTVEQIGNETLKFQKQNGFQRPLKLEEFDALVEVVNIGTGRAASALSQFVALPVQIRVPCVGVYTMEDIPKVFQALENQSEFVASMDFRGTIKGRAVLAVTSNSLDGLYELFGWPKELPPQDAILELSNVLLNGLLGSIGNIIDGDIKFNVPRVGKGTIGETLSASMPKNSSKVIALIGNTRLRVKFRDFEVAMIIGLSENEITTVLNRTIGDSMVCR